MHRCGKITKVTVIKSFSAGGRRREGVTPVPVQWEGLLPDVEGLQFKELAAMSPPSHTELFTFMVSSCLKFFKLHPCTG